MTAPGPLDGLAVVERTHHVRGRYCGRLFAELGARVTRLAQPGDPDECWLDCDKAVSADAAFADLVRGADVLIEDGPALREGDLTSLYPRLVQVSVTPFGLDGPWAGKDAEDLLVAALSGIAGINGYADGIPLREPGPQTEMVGALMAFIGALAALEERGLSGRGQLVEASSLEAMVNVLAPAVLQWSYTGDGPQRRQRGADMLFECADGWLTLYISANKAWETIVSVLEVPLEAEDRRFATEAGRRQNANAMRKLIEPILRSKTRAELFELLAPMRVVCGMVLGPDEILADPHLNARSAFRDVPGGGRIPRIPIRSRSVEPAGKPVGVPHGRPEGRLPLEHIVVTDLTQAWAGSYATQLLADLGATVIKIESRTRPDPWRGGFKSERGIQAYPSDGPGDRPYNRMWLANSVNRNKLDITLDLSNAECRELFLALVRQSDVVAENFTPRVLPNFGLDYERLRHERPGIILLSMPGYGLDGPYSDYPAIGGTIEPMSGNASLLGEPGGMPQTSGLMYPDAVAGLHGAAAVLAALARRGATGAGSHMELAQQESMLAMTAAFYARSGWQAPAGNANPCGGDERMEQREGDWFALACGEEARVRDVAAVMACPHLAARSFFVRVDQPDVGPQTMAGISPRLHRTPGRVRWATPRHGQDSRAVLSAWLGLDQLTLDRLEAAGLIGEGPPGGWDG